MIACESLFIGGKTFFFLVFNFSLQSRNMTFSLVEFTYLDEGERSTKISFGIYQILQRKS